ncbi:putative wall-associated receptor kinase, galacturonan-binding domain-containing protein [Lupinus albus]|uniref:non-specific serine/threonine protein kinase n=1 Tax=Lupinus albus TaxID=3870 RepID=A0A6A4PFI9_LUPAL|nr:putative wall-associated receptor kinase, galacturonan-binding domain-containing protein [Lupinus albus]
MLLPLHFPPSFFFILFLSLFMIIPTYFSSDHAEGYYYYSACAPFSCGNLSDITYPFWNSNQPDYCGHPKFKVDCQQDNLKIDIMSQKFDIIGINQTTQTMKIVRLDLWVDLSCSKDYTTFILDFPFFNYTTNDHYTTLFYDCDPPSYYSPPMNGAYFFTFPCSIDGDDHYAYLVLSTNLGNNFISLGCKNNTTVPILKEAELSLMKGDITLGAEYVLNEGFEVGWMGVNKDQCDSCIKSSGRCGHNIASFICLCPNDQKTYDGRNICSISPSQSSLPTLPYSMPSHQVTKT